MIKLNQLIQCQFQMHVIIDGVPVIFWKNTGSILVYKITEMFNHFLDSNFFTKNLKNITNIFLYKGNGSRT